MRDEKESPMEYLSELLDRLYEISKILYDEDKNRMKKILSLVKECRVLLDSLEGSAESEVGLEKEKT
ncbi:hypothetical protein JW710_04050 [Candidatus Dojkabacteria bacterium]|nr:hypothetical protein [Candidatus Dojkabacteria bacterium]